MKLPSEELNEQIIFIDKPAQVPSDPEDPSLFVIHRLPMGMTGCLLFAKTSEAAQILRHEFRNRQIKTKYLFLTDRSIPTDEIRANSHLFFKRVKRSPFFELWEATSSSPRPRQVQIQAAKRGIPILGDLQHGGSPFPHLCLHALELKIPSLGNWTSHEPPFMKRLGFLKDLPLIEALSQIDKAQRQFDFLNKNQFLLPAKLKLMDNSEIQADLAENQIWVQWKKKDPPSSQDQERWNLISRFLRKNLLFVTESNART